MEADPVQTPNFDRLAAEGCLCRNGVSNNPICVPWRGMTFTGRHSARNGTMYNNERWFEGIPNLFTCLKDGGYHTGYIGKWHLDHHHKEFHGREWRIDPDTGRRYQPYQWVPRERRPYFDYWHGNEVFNYLSEKAYFEESLENPITGYAWQPRHETDVALRFLDNRDPEKPFALFLSWNPPHSGMWTTPDGEVLDLDTKYPAPKEYTEPYAHLDKPFRPNDNGKWDFRRQETPKNFPGYYGAITGIDEQFGRLMDYLERQGIAEDTLVIYSADHGDLMGSHGDTGKANWYEESIGVPLIFRYPRAIKEGQSSDALFGNVSLMPTILSLAGLPLPDGMDGQDYSAMLRGEAFRPPERELIMCSPGLRVNSPEPGDWELSGRRVYVAQRYGDWRGIRTPRHTYAVSWRYLSDRDRLRVMLYDHEADPYQQKPIRGEDWSSPQFKPFHDALVAELEAVGDPFFAALDQHL
jgi:arylsulfatase A-like enzyme